MLEGLKVGKLEGSFWQHEADRAGLRPSRTKIYRRASEEIRVIRVLFRLLISSRGKRISTVVPSLN